MTGRYKEYPEYKRTDEVWLGDVPTHWRALKINRLTLVKRGASPRPIDDPKYFDETGEYAWVRIADVTASDTYLEKTTQRLSLLGASLSVKLEPNELFLSIAGTVGKPCINKIKACIHDGFVYFPEYKENIKFLFYIFSAGEAYKGLGKFGTQLNLNTETVGGIKIGIPCIEEQQKIVNFLDHETAKIETLIAKQEKLIDLLKEKRQAVVSHAVTKGLNPDSRLKYSGVEWLGEVPEHWNVPKIKQIVSIPVTDGPHETPIFVDDGVPFVSAEAVSKGMINFKKIRGYITEEQNAVYSMKYSPKIYDIYMVKSGATTGVTAIVETNYRFNIWSPLAVIRCKKNYYPYFVLNFMRSYEFLKAIELNWSFGTQQNIGMGVIENLHIACPPLEEAIEINNYLNIEINKFELIIEKANQQIILMKERKTALISAAVTGKIDVRDWGAS